MSETTIEKIDAPRALGLLADAVETRGDDYVYQKVEKDGYDSRCLYTDAEGNPSCLVGQALHLAGIDVAKLSDDVAASYLRREYSELAEIITRGAEKLFAVAQRVQDRGGTWGAAYFAAEAVADLGLVEESK